MKFKNLNLFFILSIFFISNLVFSLELITDSVTKNIEDNLLSKISPTLLNQAEQVQNSMNKKTNKSNINCYWFALSYFSKSFENNPKYISPEDFKKYLEFNFVIIDRSKIEAGDLVMFKGQFHERVFDDRDEYRPQTTFVDYTRPYHAGIVINVTDNGEIILLQKMNNRDATFSLMTLNSTIDYYKTKNVRNLRKTDYIFYRFYKIN